MRAAGSDALGRRGKCPPWASGAEKAVYDGLHNPDLRTCPCVIVETGVAPKIPARVWVTRRRCRLGVVDHDAVRCGVVVVPRVSNEVVVHARDVLLAPVERDVKAAFCLGASGRHVEVRHPVQACAIPFKNSL